MSKARIVSLTFICKRLAMMGLAFVLMFLIMSDVPIGYSTGYKADEAENNQENSKVDLHYFYFNPCPSCDVEKEFLIRLDTILGNKKEDLNLRMYNAFYGSVAEKLLQFYDEYDVTQEFRTPPILFIGNAYIQGSANIDNRLEEEFDKAKQQERILASTLESRIEAAPDTRRHIFNTQNGTDTKIMYFYVPLCAECEDVESFFHELEISYDVIHEERTINSKVEISKFNISDFENLNLLRSYFYRLGVPEDKHQVPVLFIGEHYLVGAEGITSNLHNLILSGEGLQTPIINESAEYSAAIAEGLTKFDFAGVITAGLVNGVNPCSISMLLFFLSTVASKGLTTIKIGLAFIFGRFVAYFLLGTLFFNILLAIDAQIMQSIEWIMKLLMLLVILFLVVFNIRDYFAAKTEKYDKIKMQLPVVLRRMNHKWIKSFLSVKNPRLLIAVSFILGILISIGEFLCTGQIYLLTIVYIMRNSPQLDATAILSFIVYGLALIIPMLLLLYTIHMGKEVFIVSELVRKNFQYIKLLNAFIFLVFGLIILFVL